MSAHPRLCNVCRARVASGRGRSCERCAAVTAPTPAHYQPARHELEPIYAQLIAEIGPPGLLAGAAGPVIHGTVTATLTSGKDAS